ncbi:MAG: TonB family protein [Dechloromonas sp.]|nr:MAG: TonB family protein [Dechloromonas sp.]
MAGIEMALQLRPYRPAAAMDRRLAGLVLLSLLLHGGLFVLMAGTRPAAAPALPRLLATLHLASPVPSGTLPTASLPAALPAKVRQSPAGAANRPVPRQPRTAGPASVGGLPVAGEAVAASTTAGERMSDVSPAAAAAEPVAAPPASAASLTADALAAYRQRLSELLAGQRDYPRLAALRGWQGEVRLRLRVARRGNLLAVDLERSSGFAVLDQHAQAVLADLGALPPPPDLLEGSEIQVVVPITYKLNKTT